MVYTLAHLSLAGLTLSALTSLGLGQTCPQLIDIEPGFFPVSSSPSTGVPINELGWFSTNSSFVQFGFGALMNADSPVVGVELFYADGTVGGAGLVADILGGFFNSGPIEITRVGNDAYFRAFGLGTGIELYRASLAPAGVQLVSDLFGVQSSSPHGLTELNGNLIYGATTAAGVEPWVYVSGVGALSLGDLLPGSGSGMPPSDGYARHLFAKNSAGTEAYFWARATATSTALWKTDGTPAGTQQVKLITSSALPNGWPFAGEADGFAAWQGEMYFEGWDAVNGFELWHSDGTTAGTGPVVDLAPGSASIDVRVEFATEYAGALYLVIDDGVAGPELWKTDGTAAGTQMVVDLEPGPIGSRPDELIVYNGELYFVAETNLRGRELWSLNAQDAVRLVSNIGPGATDGMAAKSNQLKLAHGRLYFTADDGSSGRELWWTTGFGATQLNDLLASFGSSSPSALTLMPNGLLMFAATGDNVGRELFATDGSSANTQLIANFAEDIVPIGSNPSIDDELVGDTYLMRARSSLFGAELHTLNVTDGSAEIAADLYPGYGAGSMGEAVPFESEAAWINGQLLYFFTATLPETGTELYVTDGTAAGAHLVDDLYPGVTGSVPTELTYANGKVYFNAKGSEGQGRELWSSDGTKGGTRIVGEFIPGPVSGDPRQITALGDRVVMAANTNGLGVELWVSDGTVAGTTLLKDINPGPLSSGIGPMYRVGDELYFSAFSAQAGAELWSTDGTPNGTRQLTEIGPGAVSSSPAEFVEANGQLFFRATRADVGLELWQLDLATQQTQLVADLVPGPTSSQPHDMVAAFGGLFLGANSPTTSILEGSLFFLPFAPGGVGAPIDLAQGMNIRDIKDLIAVGRGVYFTANEPGTGVELYDSDGTPAGTQRVCDLNPGPDGSTPQDLRAADGSLYFNGDDGAHGRELFRHNVGYATATPLAVDSAQSTLRMTPPVLGGQFQAGFAGAPAGATTFLVMSSTLAQPVGLVGITWNNVATASLVATLGASTSLSVPATPTLAGVRLHVQAYSLTPTAIEVSNGVRLQLGL